MNTYSQINIMIVFGVKNRQRLLISEIRPKVYAAITKIILDHGKGSKVIAIGGVDDHVHILISLSSSITLSDLIREIKSRSSRWINDQRLIPFHFEWQKGSGAFSYSQSHRQSVINYINNQEEHHRIKTFREELEAFFAAYDLPVNPRDLP